MDLVSTRIDFFEGPLTVDLRNDILISRTHRKNVNSLQIALSLSLSTSRIETSVFKFSSE